MNSKNKIYLLALLRIVSLHAVFFFTIVSTFCFILTQPSLAASAKKSNHFQIGDEIISHIIEMGGIELLDPNSLKRNLLLIVFASPEQEFSKKALQAVQKIIDESPLKDFKAVGIVSSSKGHQAVQKLIEKYHLNYPVLYDEGDDIATQVRILVYPTTLIINNKGELVYYYSLYASNYYNLISTQLKRIIEDKEKNHADRGMVEKQQEEGIKKAREKIESGNVKEAVNVLTTLLEKGYDSFDLRLLLGYSLINLNQPEKALVHFKKAKATQPNSTRVKVGMGIAYARSGSTGNALSLLTKIDKNDPHAFLAHRELSHMYEERGEVDKAIYYIKKELDCLTHRIKE